MRESAPSLGTRHHPEGDLSNPVTRVTPQSSQVLPLLAWARQCHDPGVLTIMWQLHHLSYAGKKGNWEVWTVQWADDRETEEVLAQFLDLFSGLEINSYASLVMQEQPHCCALAPSSLHLCLLSPAILQHLLTDSCTAGPVKWARADPHFERPAPAGPTQWVSGAAKFSFIRDRGCCGQACYYTKERGKCL